MGDAHVRIAPTPVLLMTWHFQTTDTGSPVMASRCLWKLFNWFINWQQHVGCSQSHTHGHREK